MKFMLPVALLAAAVASGPAAADGVKLAQEKQCLQCHAVNRFVIGPSFESIKAVYKTVKSPELRLIEVMRLGSDANLGPHWGTARMPNDSERPLINDAEAKELARWILSL